MSKQKMRRSVILAAACLATGMLSQPLFAEEQEAAAEAFEAPVYDYDELTVGNTTAFDGKFFTEMWGSSTSDVDVRSLIHGYNLVLWDSIEGLFDIDPSVVSGTVITENEAGDRTYTLTIYDDLFYCDGTPIKAADYAFSMLLGIAPEMKELGASTRTAEYIVGYDAYISGEAAELAGLRILGDYTFSITLDHAYLPFFYEQALLDCTPYPISVIAPGCVAVDDGNGICIVNEDEEIEEPLFTTELLESTILGENGYLTNPSVTSGPYRLTGFDGETATFEINEYYKGNHNGVKPTIKKLIFKTADNESMVGELEKAEYGLLNKCVSVDALLEGMDLVSDKEKGKYFTMGNYPRTGLSFISFCCERDTVKSAAVRQAIAMCLDKDQLVTDYVGNFGLRVDGYYGVGQWMYKAVSGTMPYPVEAPEDKQEKAAYEADLKAWGELSLDDMKVYDLNVEEAVKLLVSDGWVLNREGEEFNPEKDDVRCKEIDGETVALDLTLLYPEGNRIAESFDENFVKYLKEAGIALTVKELPMQDLVRVYYQQDGERDCDMIYLATNFELKFDPSATFKPSSEEEPETEAVSEAETEEEAEETEPDIYNVTGIEDQQLYDLAVAMRRTEPEKVLEYCQEWIAFEKRFAEVLPVIPVYSNVYFDFYPKVLHNYNISAYVSWGQAIVEAYLSDVADEPETEIESEMEEFFEG